MTKIYFQLFHYYLIFSAECVVFGANRPTNVVISELNVLPNAQVDTVTIHRDNDFNPMKVLSEKYKN